MQPRRHLPTPNAAALVKLWRAGEQEACSALLDRNWLEMWFAFPTELTKSLLEQLPPEMPIGTGTRYLAELTGADVPYRDAEVPVADAPLARVSAASVVASRLRLAGRPVAAMEQIRAVSADAASWRGHLADPTDGLYAMGLIQSGITELLGGDLRAAKGILLDATGVRESIRFPFMPRDAAAKLALALAVAGDVVRARSWVTRAQQFARTPSWVEGLIDDTLWLANYIITVDSLDFETAEAMRLEQPSPLSHLEFWGIALQAQVRHLVLTGRHDHASDLCDEVAAAGLPLEGSDGWVAAMLEEARSLAFAPGSGRRDSGPLDTVETALAHRWHLLITGQFEPLTRRIEPSPYGGDGRRDLALRLLRAQGVLGCGRRQEGVVLLLDALGEIFAKGTLGALRFLTDDAIAAIGDHELGEKVRQVLAAAPLARPQVHTFVESPLTPAQLRVLRMLRDGYSRQQIADELLISLDTVKSHLKSAYRKLGVRNRSDAAARLSDLGL